MVGAELKIGRRRPSARRCGGLPLIARVRIRSRSTLCARPENIAAGELCPHADSPAQPLLTMRIEVDRAEVDRRQVPVGIPDEAVGKGEHDRHARRRKRGEVIAGVGVGIFGGELEIVPGQQLECARNAFDFQLLRAERRVPAGDLADVHRFSRERIEDPDIRDFDYWVAKHLHRGRCLAVLDRSAQFDGRNRLPRQSERPAIEGAGVRNMGGAIFRVCGEHSDGPEQADSGGGDRDVKRAADRLLVPAEIPIAAGEEGASRVEPVPRQPPVNRRLQRSGGEVGDRSDKGKLGGIRDIPRPGPVRGDSDQAGKIGRERVEIIVEPDKSKRRLPVGVDDIARFQMAGVEIPDPLTEAAIKGDPSLAVITCVAGPKRVAAIV